MAVITISREFGSEGMNIAKKVAEELGYLLADKQTIGDLLGQYGLVEFRKIYESVPAFWEGFDTQKMDQRKITIDMMNRVIQALARHGDVVIVGRGSYLVLENFADVLNVRIQASFASRADAVMKERNLSDRAAAEAIVRENDSRREHFIESAYGAHRDKARYFDLAINTDKIPPDRAVPLIVEISKTLGRKPIAGSRMLKSIEVDQVLANVITKLFENR